MPFLTSTAGLYGYGRPLPLATGGNVAPPEPSGTLRLNIVGDTAVGTVATNLAAARTAQGYSNVTITYTSTLLNNYTGANLTTANFDVVCIYTNGAITFNASIGSNLNAYVASGGALVTGVFMWGNVPSLTNFTYTNNPYVYKGTQGTQVATMTKAVTHPITTNISTTVSNGAATFYTPTISTVGNATSIAGFPDGTSMVAIQTAPRRVGVNLFPPSGYVNIYRLYLNAILWAGGLLN